MLERDGMYVDGDWRPVTGDERTVTVNPYTEEVFGCSSVATAADVDAAVKSAWRALRVGQWRQTPLDDRIKVVEALRDAIASRTGELGAMNTGSMGMPYSVAQGLNGAVELIDMYIEAARLVRWEYLRMDATGDTLIERRPVGVVGAIVPWNVPVRSEIKKIIPAILAGCTTVLKPAAETPFGAATIAELATEAGLPEGVLNVVLGGDQTGRALVRHPLVRKIAFTGSTKTGAAIWADTADDFKRLQLELGGKSAAIVLADCDLDAARPYLSGGIFALSGQACTATSRILVPRERRDELVDMMVEEARSQVMGDPFDASTTLGPLVSRHQQERVLGLIETAVAQGAQVAAGGGRPRSQNRGWFVEPTVLTGVDSSMGIAQEEVFGPVVVVMEYRDEAEAVRIANDSRYGLAGAVYSADPERALHVARQVDSGSLGINRYGLPASAPFGGLKASGIGREHGVEGYDSFLEYVSYPLEHSFAEKLASGMPLYP